MSNQIKCIRINQILLVCLFLAQPFIVMFQANILRDIQLFGFSVFEFFNIVLSLLSMCLCIYTYPNKRVFYKYIPYVVLLGIYTVLHGWNIYQFDQSTYSLQSPNFLVESYYIFRTFVVPLLLVFDIYYAQFKKDQLLRVLEIFVAIVSVVMVLSNIFHIALRNYTDGSIYNSLSLLDWFTFENHFKYSYYDLTTKGWFLSGNQMSAILFMTYPVMLWRAYDQRTKFQYGIVFFQTLAMFMLGTKTANVGAILILIVFIVLWGIFRILKQVKKGVITIVCIGFVFVLLLPFSPVGYKIRYTSDKESTGSQSGGLLDSAVNAEVDEYVEIDWEKLSRESKLLKQMDVKTMSEKDLLFVKEYMEEFCGFFGISPYIIEHYNDLEHSRFWANYMQETPNNDYRVLKTMILKEIYKNNNNPYDRYLGMGYTLNYIYTEADYTYQYYSYGIFGILVLIMPYFYLLLYIIYQGLRHFKKMFTLECALYVLAPTLGLIAAKYSGHVLERTFPLMVMAYLFSIVLIHIKMLHNEEQSIDRFN